MFVEFIDNTGVETFDAKDGFTAKDEGLNDWVLLWSPCEADNDETKVLLLPEVGSKVDLVVTLR